MDEELEACIVDLDGEKFEIIDTLNFEGKDYAALTPYTEDDELEDDNVDFVILEIIDDENDEENCVLKTVDDDALLSRLEEQFISHFDVLFGEDDE